MRKHFNLCLLPIMITLSSFPPVNAQRLSGTAGFFYNRITSIQDYNYQYTYHHGLAFSIGWYFKNMLHGDRKSVFGVKLFGFEMDGRETEKESQWIRSEIEYSFFGIVLNHRFCFSQFNNRYYFILNNGLGIFGQSDKDKGRLNNYCDDVFCYDPPDFRPVYIPRIEYLIRINDALAVQMIAQYVVVLGDSEDIRPFSSLATFQVGLCFSEISHKTSQRL